MLRKVTVTLEEPTSVGRGKDFRTLLFVNHSVRKAKASQFLVGRNGFASAPL